jgi:hypothetical protein
MGVLAIQERELRHVPHRDRAWYRSWWVRGPVLVLFVAFAGLPALDPRSWITHPIPARIAVGALIAVVALLACGLMVTGVLALARRPLRLGEVVLSFPLILVVWAAIALAGIARDDQGAPAILAPQRADAAEVALAAERDAFGLWYEGVARAQFARAQATRRFRAWAADGAEGTPAGFRRLRAAERSAAGQVSVAVSLEPTAATAGATTQLRGGAQGLLACISATRALLQTVNLGNVEARRARINERCATAERLLRQADRSAAGTFARLGGDAAFPGLEQRVDALARGAA